MSWIGPICWARKPRASCRRLVLFLGRMECGRARSLVSVPPHVGGRCARSTLRASTLRPSWTTMRMCVAMLSHTPGGPPALPPACAPSVPRSALPASPFPLAAKALALVRESCAPLLASGSRVCASLPPSTGDGAAPCLTAPQLGDGLRSAIGARPPSERRSSARAARAASLARRDSARAVSNASATSGCKVAATMVSEGGGGAPNRNASSRRTCTACSALRRRSSTRKSRMKMLA